MPISLSRLEERLKEMAQIGKNKENGITRLAYTDSDLEARELLSNWIIQIGLDVHIDGVGNIFAKRQGNKNGPVVMIGSHLDTVTNGGAFDGTLGVISALEVLQVLIEDNISDILPVELVVFACEESSRFGCSLVGSKYLTGSLLPEKLETYHDEENTSIISSLQQKGFIYNNTLARTTFIPENVKGFIELHIEQHDTLAKSGLAIGIIENIAAPTRLKIVVTGEAAHSGAAPMFDRKDALAAAAEVILLIEKLGRSEAAAQTVATVTSLKVDPGNMNVIPGTVSMFVDIRSINSFSKKRVLAELKEEIKGICLAREGIKMEINVLSEEEPVSLDKKIIAQIKTACQKIGVPYQFMNSPAGHDCMAMASVVPSGLFFIRNISGVSHNPQEMIDLDDVYIGTQVLYETVRKFSAEGVD